MWGFFSSWLTEDDVQLGGAASPFLTADEKAAAWGAHGEPPGKGPPADGEDPLDAEVAAIVRALAPRTEPWNPCTAAFWRRHFGTRQSTDFLVGSWLFLVSSAVFLALAVDLILGAKDAADTADAAADMVSAALFTAGSTWFVAISYPEELALFMLRAHRADCEALPWFERYFTHNSMLLATWSFALAFLPYAALGGYYIAVGCYAWGAIYVGGALLSMLLVGAWVVSAMPDSVQANGGRGSSIYFDACCCCCAAGEDSCARKHLGTDVLVGAWLFAGLGLAATAAAGWLVATAPTNLDAWISFFSVAPFGVGAMLILRASYPGYEHASLCCGAIGFDEDGQVGEETALHKDIS
ncbi:hypothetical protein M885DRAFT_571414 [Pelagophyceae sp. CCMP2097]|nr:hypothetical protein M885DRAFT_571414 [Pelagophyceae sp. CCMP2097]